MTIHEDDLYQFTNEQFCAHLLDRMTGLESSYKMAKAETDRCRAELDQERRTEWRKMKDAFEKETESYGGKMEYLIETVKQQKAEIAELLDRPPRAEFERLLAKLRETK